MPSGRPENFVVLLKEKSKMLFGIFGLSEMRVEDKPSSSL